MGKPNYRVVVSFDPQRQSFSARAPELEHLTGEGPSRKEAIAKLEEEIDAQLANMLSLGSQPPKAVDEIDHSGEVTAKISKSLHRELFYMSQSEGVEVDQLVSELLAAALTQRQGSRGGTRRPQAAAGAQSDDIGNRIEAPRHSNADGNRADGNRGGGGFRRGGNPQLLDDRANFIEYVRNQEQAPAPSRGPGFQRNNGGGGGGGGNNEAGNRRRRGGRGGQGQQAGGGQGNQGGQGGHGQGNPNPNRDANRNRDQNRGPRPSQPQPPAAAPQSAPDSHE